MKLIRTYSKMIFVRNYLKYLYVLLSIIASYIILAIASLYVTNVLNYVSISLYSNIHFVSISALTIFFMSGLIIIVYQFYSIMKSCIGDFFILYKLGATKHTIRILIMIQGIALMIVSIPIGLLSAYVLTGFIADYIQEYSMNLKFIELLTSNTSLLLVALFTVGVISFIGFYLDRNIKNMLLSNVI